LELKEIEIIDASQALYDAFNGFILSSDTKVFGKLLARTMLVDQVKHLPGDIVECGVFKGTGLLTFLKLKKFLCPNSGKKVIGFDFFNSSDLIESLSGQDKEAMSTLFDKRNYKHEAGYSEQFRKMILGFGIDEHEFELVEGDITRTASEYVMERPGFRISLLYLDLDLDIPTYEALNAMWDRVVKGGIVVFDEYAFHKWSESKGVDRFFADKDVQIKSMNFICPTAYVVKK
jgi:hypothetical protein